jgi:hypothetical protein
MERSHPVFDGLLHDSRRDAWIALLPARDFIMTECPADERPAALTCVRVKIAVAPEVPAERPLTMGERTTPWVMLAWAFVVWTFLCYDLGHFYSGSP